MSPTREEALFALALEKPAAKRAVFLEAMCEGDAALRQRVEALLAAHEATANPLHTDRPLPTPPSPWPTPLPQRRSAKANSSQKCY